MTDRFARTDGSTTAPCDLLDYCGGTWRGTINQLDYIQGMGFDAVMISPIIQNLEGRVKWGEAYHGYWPIDLYNLNSHFGTAQDLLDLSAALHSRGMYLMMDTVINNMAYFTNGSDPATSIDYSVFKPFNNADYFHPYCQIVNWNNYTDAQLCQTGDNITALPDLFTEHTDVQQLLEDWATDTMQKYSIDGLRIDAAKHVSPGFLKNFGDKVGAFMTGEVYDGSVDTICNYQSQYIGSMPNYPVYYGLIDAFTKGNVSHLANTVEDMKNACPDVSAMVSFSENHDLSRIGNLTDDISLAKSFLTFTMLFDGVPMIYQGQEQHLNGGSNPLNREAIWLTGYQTDSVLYKLTATLNGIRKHAIKLDAGYVDIHTRPIYTGGSELAFSKGAEGRQVIMVLSNQGTQGKAYTLQLPVTYTTGTVAMDVLNCKNYTVDQFGSLTIDMDQGEPRVLFPTKLLDGSGLCGYPLTNVTLADLKNGRGSGSTSLGARNKGSANDKPLLLVFMLSLMLLGMV